MLKTVPGSEQALQRGSCDSDDNIGGRDASSPVEGWSSCHPGGGLDQGEGCLCLIRAALGLARFPINTDLPRKWKISVSFALLLLTSRVGRGLVSPTEDNAAYSTR